MARHTEVVLLLILAAAAFASATFHPFRKRCPYGWKNYGTRCYLYQAINLNWISAENHCQSLGGHLVSIHNENEYQVIKVLSRADHHKTPIWISLSRCQQKFKWVWSDGSPVTFTKWNPREPNRLFGVLCAYELWKKEELE
ncbi:hypothetical protein QTP86_031378 [Hemibagrus guttatus]|nr:hypothetical protein QTP86_031378 [Hemibagrus guttatus]